MAAFYKPGDIIYSGKPFAQVVYYEDRETVCDHCLQRSNSSLKACAACRYVCYCNRKCQKAAWKRHKKECPLLKNIPVARRNFIRLVGQVILLLKHTEWSSHSEPVGNLERTFADLVSNCEFTKNDPKLSLHGLEVTRLLKEYLGTDNMPDDDETLEIIGKVKHNRFGVPVGSAVYIGGSVFNHSCVPNASRYTKGRKMTIRAITDIPLDNVEKVTIAYAPMVDAVDKLEKIKKSFYGPCICDDCSLPYGESKLTKIKDKTRACGVIELTEVTLVKLQNCLKNLNVLSTSHLMRQNLSNLEQILKMQENVLGDTNIIRIRLLAGKAFMEPNFEQKVQDLMKVAAYIIDAFGENSEELIPIYDMLATLPQSRREYDPKVKALKKLLYGDEFYLM